MRKYVQFGQWRCLVFCATLLLASVSAFGQGTGTLQVSLSVQSSIGLVFLSHPGAACTLGGSGTNNATLYLGTGSAPLFGIHDGCGTYATVDWMTYSMSSAFDLKVDVANSTSTRYDLRYWVSTTPSNGVSYYLNTSNTPLSLTRPTAAMQTNSYGTTTETFKVQVASLTAPMGRLNDTIQFEALAR